MRQIFFHFFTRARATRARGPDVRSVINFSISTGLLLKTESDIRNISLPGQSGLNYRDAQKCVESIQSHVTQVPPVNFDGGSPVLALRHSGEDSVYDWTLWTYIC